MYYLFTEDGNGKYGWHRKEFFSKVEADHVAEDYLGITHIVEAEDLAEAKQILRGRLVKKKGNEELYRNIRNRPTGEE